MSQYSKFYLGTGAAPIEKIVVGVNDVLPSATGGITFTSPYDTISLDGATASTVKFDVTTPNMDGYGLTAFSGGPPYVDYTTTIGSVTVTPSCTGFIASTPATYTGPQTVSGLVSGHAYWVYVNLAGNLQFADMALNPINTIPGFILYCVYRDVTPGTNLQHCTTIWESSAMGIGSTKALLGFNGFKLLGARATGLVYRVGVGQISVLGPTTIVTPFYNVTIADPAGVAITWNVMYLIGADAARYAVSNTLTAFYNNTGVPTALTVGYYVIYSLYQTVPDSNTAAGQYYAVMDSAQYATAAEARYALATYLFDDPGNLLSIGLVRLGFAIVSQTTGDVDYVYSDIESTDARYFGMGTRLADMLPTDTTNFNHILSATDTTVQTALDTIDNITSIISWEVVVADVNPMVAGHGYICNLAGLITLTLPAVAAVGDRFRITGINTALGWSISQNAGQQIHVGINSTTVGVGGSLSSSQIRDSVELICVVANLEFNVISLVGNLTVV